MDKSLLDFQLVDRFNEKQIIKDFLSGKSDKNILWVDGQSGVGKSFLVEKYILPSTNDCKIHICKSAQNRSETILAELIEQLNKASKISFMTFLTQYYDSVFDIATKLTKTFFQLKNIDIDSFVALASDSNKLFISKLKEKQNAAKLLNFYIEHILKSKQILIICDNMTYYDQKSLEIILEIIKTHQNKNSIKFVIVTTSEQVTLNKYLRDILMEKISLQYILLKPFDDEKYFRQILNSKFFIDKALDPILSHVFELCEGVPEQFKNIIRELMLSNGIEPQSPYNKPTINKNILEQQLHSNIKNTSPGLNLALINDIERLFFQILFYMNYCVPRTVLSHAYKYIYQRLFAVNVDDRVIVNFLNKYIIVDVLTTSEEKGIELIALKRGFLYLRLKAQFERAVNKQQIYQYLYNFNIDNTAVLIQNGLHKKHIKDINCYYAYSAQSQNWVEINFNYGFDLYRKRYYYQSAGVFTRFISHMRILSSNQALIMALAYYHAGQYIQCRHTLDCICVNKLSTDKKYTYFYLYGNTLYMLRKADEAVSKLNKALQYASAVDEYYSAINIKLMALAESKQGLQEARDLFQTTVENLNAQLISLKPICSIFRNCWFFCSGQEALVYLKQAIILAEELKDDTELAYVHNNIGREYISLWEIDNAKDAYLKSYNILSNTKRHETSYPLNNLAILEMMHNNFHEALQYLLEAQLWNESPFMEVVLKTNEMICHMHSNELENCKSIADMLYNYLFNQDIEDIHMIRKLSNNLCMVFMKLEENDKAKACLSVASKYIKDTNSEFRAILLHNRLFKEQKSLENIKLSSTYYKYDKFEPWIVTICHE